MKQRTHKLSRYSPKVSIDIQCAVANLHIQVEWVEEAPHLDRQNTQLLPQSLVPPGMVFSPFSQGFIVRGKVPGHLV